MAQAGIYAPSSVIDADVTVRVNGVVREHQSMDWAGDTSGGLPDQVVSAGTGMRSRTGSILWAQQNVVQVDPPHPLRQTGGWPPREGDEVVIDATVDTGQGPYTFRRFTGRLGRTTGSLTDGTLSSEITDTLGDVLHTPVSIPPALTGGYGRSYRVAYLAFEAAGLGLIPTPSDGAIIHSVPQGGIAPTVGGDVGLPPGGAWLARQDPEGFTVWNDLATETGTSVRPAESSVLVVGRGSSLWSSELQVRFTIGTIVRLEFAQSTRMLTMRVGGGVVWSGPYEGAETIPVLAFQSRGDTVRIWTGINSSVTVAYTLPSGTVRDVWGTALAAVDVSYASAGVAGGLEYVARTAQWPVGITRSALEVERVPATRGVENVTARSVVDSWSQATLASVWMDEHGRARAVARDQLVAAPVSRTVRIEDRVFTGSWSVGDDSVRSSVVVTAEQGAVRGSPEGEYRHLAHQGSSIRSFSADATEERFVEAPTEEDWGPLDLNPALAYGQGNEFWGSWYGGVVVGGGYTGSWFQHTGMNYAVALERLGQRTIKITESVSNIPAGARFFPQFAEPESTTDTYGPFRGTALPVIRAAWVTTWVEYSVTGASKGPAWAPMLEHDAGWWLTPADAQRFADALSAEVSKPMPTLSGVSLLWDPLRQIGDVEEWIATDSTGAEAWRARVLVTGYSEAWDGRVPSQTVDVRVISWTDPRDGKTYDDLLRVYGSYHQIEGYQPTYGQLYDALPDHF